MFGIKLANIDLSAIKAEMADVWTFGGNIGHPTNQKKNKTISGNIDIVNMSTDSLIFRISFNA